MSWRPAVRSDVHSLYRWFLRHEYEQEKLGRPIPLLVKLHTGDLVVGSLVDLEPDHVVVGKDHPIVVTYTAIATVKVISVDEALEITKGVRSR